MDHKKVLGIVLLGGLGEIEGPRYHGLPVDDHYLVMGNGVGCINLCGDPRIYQEIGGRVFLPFLTFVQDHLHLHLPLVGIKESLSDWG